MLKLGLIAGGGNLPRTLAERCIEAGRPFFVIRLKGFADAGLEDYPGADIGMAELGKCFAALKNAGCQAGCFAGFVARPDFSALKPVSVSYTNLTLPTHFHVMSSVGPMSVAQTYHK